MGEGVLTAGKLVFLALLYLFFLRVVRAVWVEMSPTRMENKRKKPAKAAPEAPQAEAPKMARSTPTAIKVLRAIDGSGTRYDLTDAELTIGRAPGCAISIEDSYASQLHARVFLNEGARFVEDLGSTNGTFLNDEKVSAPKRVHTGDELRIGNTTLEFVR